MQGAQFVYYAPKRPNVALFVVFLVVNLLRRHVVRGANVREGELRLVVEHSGQTEVAQFDVAVQVKENVARFQIPVQDLLRHIRI